MNRARMPLSKEDTIRTVPVVARQPWHRHRRLVRPAARVVPPRRLSSSSDGRRRFDAEELALVERPRPRGRCVPVSSLADAYSSSAGAWAEGPIRIYAQARRAARRNRAGRAPRSHGARPRHGYGRGIVARGCGRSPCRRARHGARDAPTRSRHPPTRRRRRRPCVAAAAGVVRRGRRRVLAEPPGRARRSRARGGGRHPWWRRPSGIGLCATTTTIPSSTPSSRR